MSFSLLKPSTVLIVGGGIAGPTLALLLKQKGYLPILVEKVPDFGDVGIALALAPNGMKVLDHAGVALDLMIGPPSSPSTLRWDEFTSSGEFLGGTGLHSHFTESYGWPSIGITRTRLQTLLLDRCRDHDIPVHVGWKLAAFNETDDGIVARAEDGREVRADFIVGADGLKSRTRELLLEKRGVQVDQPLFTHIIVQGGYSPMPASLQEVPAIRIWYGATKAMISHPLENGMAVWGLTCDAQDATSESWRTVPTNELDREITSTLDQLEGWADPVRELVSNSRKIMTIGLYDRPELPIEHWYHGRGVLIGDAAHPTTPHIGQGANQALEDCWHLANLLPPCDASSTETLSSKALEDVFHRMASTRQGPSSLIVRLAREQGEVRVVTDASSNAAWKKRDDAIRAKWADAGKVKSFFDSMYQEPFDGKGGYAHAITSRNLKKETET